jgi:hypothetical protein
VIVQLVLNVPFQLRNLENVQKMSKLNVLQNQLVTGHLGATGPIAVAIVVIKHVLDLESVTVVINQNAKQKNKIVPDPI